MQERISPCELLEESYKSDKWWLYLSAFCALLFTWNQDLFKRIQVSVGCIFWCWRRKGRPTYSAILKKSSKEYLPKAEAGIHLPVQHNSHSSCCPQHKWVKSVIFQLIFSSQLIFSPTVPTVSNCNKTVFSVTIPNLCDVIVITNELTTCTEWH